jgi:hypothetical protein
MRRRLHALLTAGVLAAGALIAAPAASVEAAPRPSPWVPS